MFRDFVHATKHIHHVRLHDKIVEAQRQAEINDEHHRPRRLRDSVGARLIRMGERLIGSGAVTPKMAA